MKVSGASADGWHGQICLPYPNIPSGESEQSDRLEHSATLDPSDWPGFRAQAHRMMDDMLDYTEHIRDRPVWQPIPQSVRDSFRQPLPQKPGDLASVHRIFMRQILPYSVGNVHPEKRLLWDGFTAVGLRPECWLRCSRPA